jgi:hypothetical protein
MHNGQYRRYITAGGSAVRTCVECAAGLGIPSGSGCTCPADVSGGMVPAEQVPAVRSAAHADCLNVCAAVPACSVSCSLPMEHVPRGTFHPACHRARHTVDAKEPKVPLPG